jgi:hypothetical protein
MSTQAHSRVLEGTLGYSATRGGTLGYSQYSTSRADPAVGHRRAFHLMRVRRLHADAHREERAVRQHHVEDLRPRAADGSQSFP